MTEDSDSESEYGEYPGGYTADYPPHWLRPLLEEYPSLTVEACGYQQGSWAKISFDAEEMRSPMKVERATTNAISFGRHSIRTGVSSNQSSSTADRDTQIGQVLADKLGGYESFDAALADMLGR